MLFEAGQNDFFETREFRLVEFSREDKTLGFVTGQVKELLLVEISRKPERERPVLTCSQDIAWASQFEILLGDGKAIRGPFHDR